MPSPDLSALWWFIAVVATIPLVLWLLKRTPLGGHGSAAGAPRTVAVLALSTSQKLVTVELGQGEERVWLVLGVTAQSIRALHTMVPQAAVDAGPVAPPTATFQQLLSRLRGGGQ